MDDWAVKNLAAVAERGMPALRIGICGDGAEELECVGVGEDGEGFVVDVFTDAEYGGNGVGLNGAVMVAFAKRSVGGGAVGGRVRSRL